MSLIIDRAAAARDTLDKIRALTPADNTPAQVEALTQALKDLAARTELFPLDHYPIKENGRGGFYRLIEDADRGNAIYVSVAPGAQGGPRRNTPHRHVGWACIVGITGEEYNAIYDRVDDGSVPGKGKLHKKAELTIRPGIAAFLPAGDYHHIELNGAEPSLHLHVYALGVDSDEQAQQPLFPSPEAEEYSIGNRPEALQRIAVPSVSIADVTDAHRTRPVSIHAVDGADIGLPDGLPAASPLSSAVGPDKVPEDRATPIILIGQVIPVEVAAEKFARLGFHTLLRLPS